MPSGANHRFQSTTFNGMTVKDVGSDGNCLFRAVAFLINGSEDDHMKFREQTVAWLMENKDIVLPFMGGISARVDFHREFGETDYQEYVAKLRNDGIWGGEESLLALASIYNYEIDVHRTDMPTWKLKPKPGRQGRKKTINVFHVRGTHYMALTK